MARIDEIIRAIRVIRGQTPVPKKGAVARKKCKTFFSKALFH